MAMSNGVHFPRAGRCRSKIQSSSKVGIWTGPAHCHCPLSTVIQMQIMILPRIQQIHWLTVNAIRIESNWSKGIAIVFVRVVRRSTEQLSEFMVVFAKHQTINDNCHRNRTQSLWMLVHSEEDDEKKHPSMTVDEPSFCRQKSSFTNEVNRDIFDESNSRTQLQSQTH